MELELGGDPKQLGYEAGLRDRIFLRYPPHSALPNHAHRFDSLQRPPRRRKRTVSFRETGPLLHRAMVLFHVIEVLALTQPNPPRKRALRFQRLDRGWVGGVLVYVDHPGHRIAGSAQGLAEEAFGSGSVSFGREQEVDGLTGRVHGSVQILVLALDLYIGLVGAVAFVRRLQMRPAAFVQLGCVCLDPAPDATGVHRNTAFRQNLGDMFLGQGIT